MTLPLTLPSAASSVVPVLETADLLLRGPRPDDLAEFAAMHNDPDFYRYLSGKPQPEEDVWRRILTMLGSWPMLGYGYWVVEEKATGRMIGGVGFADYQRDTTPSIKGAPEAGWVLTPHVHRRGYATQAVQAILDWGDVHFPATRTACIIHPENQASLRLAHKFGYREVARTLYHDAPIVILERPPAEQRVAALAEEQSHSLTS